MKHDMSKKKQAIEEMRTRISHLLYGMESTKRINDINWLVQDIMKEQVNLFQYPSSAPKAEREQYIDYTNINNIVPTWRYIMDNQFIEIIDYFEIREIHKNLCANTDIPGGRYRMSEAYIERLQKHAPSPYQLNDIMYNITAAINDERIPVLERAFKAHYELIEAQIFEDFNKRTARMIMNWILVRGGYRPVLFNKKSDNKEYMNALLAMAQGNNKAYMYYMYSCMYRTQKEILKRLEQAKTPHRR